MATKWAAGSGFAGRLATLAGALFALESLLMLLLARLPLDLPPWGAALLDAFLLVLLALPLFYLLLVRPLARQNRRLARTERELRALQAEMEAKVAARTVELDRALARQRAHAERLARFTDAAQLLFASRDQAEIGRVVAGYLGGILPAAQGALYAHRTSRDALERVSSWRDEQAPFPETLPAGRCFALRRGQLHHGGTAPGKIGCGEAACQAPHALCIPLTRRRDGARPGGDPPAGRPGERRARRAGQLPTAASSSTPSGRRWQWLWRGSSCARRCATRRCATPLTGLYNRRFADEALALGVAAAARRGEPYAVALLDLDHFKALNDTHGHRAGDQALAAVAAEFRRTLRRSDVVCRYGGEEFLVLMPGTSLAQAVEVVDRLRAAVERLLLDLPDGRRLQITLSAGVAAHPEQGADPDNLVRWADTALYAAKRAGRNRVVSAALVAAEEFAPTQAPQEEST
ncbi:MAG: hypothetical protein KatS3mg124_1028 [Porticoccaceae bacterium]|nr:MAG: hypothetical protein KatS3mg124_1028 [Porticoccaceae bacterium]